MKQLLMRFNRKFDNNRVFHNLIFWPTLIAGYFACSMLDGKPSGLQVAIPALLLSICFIFIISRLAMEFGVYSRQERDEFNREMDKYGK